MVFEARGHPVRTPLFFQVSLGKKHSLPPLRVAGWWVGWLGWAGWLGWLVGWLAGWLVGCLVGWLAGLGWFAGCLVGDLDDRLAVWLNCV